VSGVLYEPVGPWWTLDAPSLRLPVPGGGYVPVWTVGEGPSLLLVHRRDDDHDAWLPLLPHLQDHLTLHALQLRPQAPETAAADLAAAVAGLGVRQVLTDGDSAAAVLNALVADGSPARLLTHAAPPGLPARAGAVTVLPVGHAHGRVGDAPAALAEEVLRMTSA
jgi:hypothetical protein